jgi:DNA-binding LacI/PurR family transcriptional regulator
VVFSFGRRKIGDAGSGPTNLELARIVNERWAELPVMAQPEIARALTPSHREVVCIDRHGQRRAYLDTHEVAYQAAQHMGRLGCRRPIVVAQQHHLPRAEAVLRRLGLDVVVTTAVDAPFDERSSQVWTRSRVAWALRELLTIPYYRSRRWL